MEVLLAWFHSNKLTQLDYYLFNSLSTALVLVVILSLILYFRDFDEYSNDEEFSEYHRDQEDQEVERRQRCALISKEFQKRKVRDYLKNHFVCLFCLLFYAFLIIFFIFTSTSSYAVEGLTCKFRCMLILSSTCKGSLSCSVTVTPTHN